MVITLKELPPTVQAALIAAIKIDVDQAELDHMFDTASMIRDAKNQLAYHTQQLKEQGKKLASKWS